MFFDKEEYKQIINIPLAVIIASFIIIIITTNLTDTNALSALIGGYSGLLLGLIFILILNWPPTSWFDLFPFMYIIIIISLLIYYLSTYFEEISMGHVSSYYSSFSLLSTIFLATQMSIILSAIFSNTSNINIKLFSDTTFALLGLFGVINFLIVITIGIVLHFYSTQG
jgi:hypothetical protein